MFVSRQTNTHDQARELLQQHCRMSVGAALERAGPVGDAIAELAFSGKSDWTYAEARARLETLKASTMPVGQWLGRYHASRAMP